MEPESSGLKRIQATKSYDYIISEALSDHIGMGELYITKSKPWTSLLKPDVKAAEQLLTERCLSVRPFEITETVNIALTTLDAIAPTLPAIDYLQLDVQGGELLVLQGAVHTLENIAMIELETRFYQLYQQEPIFSDIHAFMTQHGFMLLQLVRQGDSDFGEKFVDGNACYCNSQLAAAQPKAMSMFMAYAKNKHAFYGNKVLRLLCDI